MELKGLFSQLSLQSAQRMADAAELNAKNLRQEANKVEQDAKRLNQEANKAELKSSQAKFNVDWQKTINNTVQDLNNTYSHIAKNIEQKKTSNTNIGKNVDVFV